MIISDDVVFSDSNNVLKTDVVEIDIKTKNTKFYMYDKDHKVSFKTTKQKMGIIKKFRIKSFKNKNSLIEFENISLSYGNRLILDNINFPKTTQRIQKLYWI